MQNIMRCLRNLKMRQQVIIVDFLIIVIAFSLILGTYLIQSNILFSIVQNSSSAIFVKQERRSLQYASSGIKQYLERKYYQSILNVIHIDSFFKFTFQNQKSISNLSEQLYQPCVELEDIDRLIVRYHSSLFCYQSLNSIDGVTLAKNNRQIDFFNLTTSLFSEYSLLFDVTFDTQVSFIDLPNTLVMATYPEMFQFKNFTISQRPWFKYHLAMQKIYPNASYHYSPVYLSVQTYEYSRAITSTIYAPDGDVIGITRNTLPLNDSNISQIPINLILTTQDGEVILSSLESMKGAATHQFYIQNETETGFNSSDWLLIQQYIGSNTSQQLCDDYPNTFCLYNKIFNQSVQVNALEFKDEKFNLIVFVNVTFEAALTHQFTNLTSNLLSLIIRDVWILIICSFTVIIATAILLRLIFSPLLLLMQNISLHLCSMGNNLNSEIFKMMNKRRKQSNVFSDLTIRFMTLQDLLAKSQTQKGNMCQQIESIQYNIKPPDIDYCQISQNVKKIVECYTCQTQDTFSSKSTTNSANRQCFGSSTLKLINQALIEQYRNTLNKNEFQQQYQFYS